MGGHGGLNILPQKRWNVYNYENREKVRRDEEAAAKEEQLKREQARKRDTEFRLEQLRAARGLAPLIKAQEEPEAEPKESEAESGQGHINLFEGIKIFDPIKDLEKAGGGDERDGGTQKKKKMKTKQGEAEAGTRVVTADDEKYRLGYGVAGKGVKLPWYLEKRNAKSGEGEGEGGIEIGRGSSSKEDTKRSGKKTLEELREERLGREKREKERERALIMEKSHPRDNRVRDGASYGHIKLSRR